MRHLHLIAALTGLLIVAACGQSGTNTESSASVSNCPKPDADGVIQVTDGLTATVTSRGYGREAVAGDYADVHTTLWLYDASGGRRPRHRNLDLGW